MNRTIAALSIFTVAYVGPCIGGLYAQTPSPTPSGASIIDLGVLPGALGGSSARAVNNSGVVVGESSVFKAPIFSCGAAFDFHAFRWSRETGMQDLGVLANGCNSLANAISDTGFIAGYSQELFGLLSPRNLATIWAPGALSPSPLGFPSVAECQGQTQIPPSDCQTFASGINPTGETVVGYTAFGPFTWNPTTGMQLLGLSNKFAVYGMNSLGVVACSHQTGNVLQACLLKPDGSVIDLPINGQFCEAFAVNDSNEATGYCEPPSGTPDIAMFWDKNGAAQAIGVNGFPQGIDSQGDVVGEGEEAPGLAFLWTKAKGVTYLSTFLPPGSGWTLQNAYAINDKGQVVGDGIHNGLSRAFLLNLDPCIDAGGDTDRDGLCDDWEREGIKDASGNMLLDLPAMGADPNHKDIFVEIDYMDCALGGCAAGDNHTHFPDPTQLQQIVQAFDTAPVDKNPDGTTGIHLHLMVDEPVPEVPVLRWDPNNMNGADDFTGIKLGTPAPGNPCGIGNSDGHFGTRDERFSPDCQQILDARAKVFHYALIAHDLVIPGKSGPLPVGGLGEEPGNNLVVAQGQPGPDFLGYLQSALMHELGHNLGLGHGGNQKTDTGDEVNCKPNYLSIMNYPYAYRDVDQFRPLDYSHQELPPLNKEHLNEALGIQGPSSRAVIYGFQGQTVFQEPASGPIDWNEDGQYETDVADPGINWIDDFGCVGDGTVLTGYNDWANLVYYFRDSRSFLSKIGVFPQSKEHERTAEEVYALAKTRGTLTDNIPPVTAVSLSPSPNGAGWNNLNVTANLTSTDNEPGGSGVKQITYSATGAQAIASTILSGSSASIIVSSEGVTTLSFFGTDNAGNVETTKQVVVMLDKTPPSINCGASDGIWHATDATIACGANDSGSGLVKPSDASFSLSTSVPSGTETSNAATGTHSVCDVAGNCATAGPINGNMVDKKPPSINVTSPTSGASYLLNQTVNANYTCSDGGSGVATCSGTVATGSTIDTASVGSKTFTVNATDKVGNAAAPQLVSYSVTYGSCILYDPTRSVQSGSTIPLKLQLCDVNNADVSNSSVVVHAASLAQLSTNAPEVLAASGNANPDNDFRFDSSLGPTGGYIFNLSTKGLTTGSYLLSFTAGGDPTLHPLTFQVR